MAAIDVSVPVEPPGGLYERFDGLDEVRFVSNTNKRRRLELPATSTSRTETCVSKEQVIAEDEVEEHTYHSPQDVNTPKKHPSDLNKIFDCPYESCEKSFNRPARLEEHLRSHTNDRLFKCSSNGCDKTFLRQSHLAHHVKSAHTSVRDYVCQWEGCEKSFLTATRLKRHNEAHEGRQQFRCRDYPPCDKSFRKHATLQRHIEVDHLDQKPFPCYYLDEESGTPCSSAYDSAAKLQAHVKKHYSPSRFECAVCSSSSVNGEITTISFKTYNDLLAHMKSAHPPKCNECNRTFARSKDLQDHITAQHSSTVIDERRNWVCQENGCGKGFTRQSNLKTHMRTVHNREKPFKCGETDLSNSAGLENWDNGKGCGNSFTAKASLETHVKKQHLGLSKAVHRQEKKQRRQEKKQRSTLAGISGIDEDSMLGTDMPCIVSTCELRFMGEVALVEHAKIEHQMDEQTILEDLRELEALQGGVFWIGGGDEDLQVGHSPGLPQHWQEMTEFNSPAVEFDGQNLAPLSYGPGDAEQFIDPFLVDLQNATF